MKYEKKKEEEDANEMIGSTKIMEEWTVGLSAI